LSTTIDTHRLNIVFLLTIRAASWCNAARAGTDDFSEGDVDEAAWKAFGEWIEQRRQHAGLTVGELAERAGVSRVWLQVLRKGGRRIEGDWRPPNPKSDALARVARALDVPVEEMFARAGRDAASSATGAGSQEGSPHDDVGPEAVDRIRELEERVARTEQEMAELRQLLERQRAGRANVR
jgi:transcriptional regulator with XRE-family HTH domain